MLDDDDKTRRNLVAASAAIVFLYWLDVPIGRQVERILGITHGAIADSKMLAAGFVLLAYLSLRYSFSGDGDAYRSAITDKFNNLRFSKVMWLTQYMIDRYAKSKIESPVFNGQLSAFVNEFLQSTNSTHLSGRGRLVLKATIREQVAAPWKHQIYVAPTIFDNTRMHASSSASVIEVNIDQKGLRAVVNIWAYAQAHFYSEPAIKAGLPVYFGVISALTLWSRLLSMV